MSITFMAENAPTEVVPCSYCEEKGAQCLDGCDGTTIRCLSPEANFSNMNALTVMELVGIREPDYCGRVEISSLPLIQQGIMVKLHKPGERAWAVADEASGGGDGSCRWFYGGNTDEATVRRLELLRDVVTWAQDNGRALVWG